MGEHRWAGTGWWFRRGGWLALLFVVVTIGIGLPIPAQATSLVVKIDGVDKKTKKTVRRVLSIVRVAPNPETTVAEIRRLHRKAPTEITQVLESLGYYQPQIDSSLEIIDETWIARYKIEPGPPVIVASVDIQIHGPGKYHAPLLQRLDDFPLKKGDQFRHAAYESAKSGPLKQALRDGYLDAELTHHVVRLDRLAMTAEIELQLETGTRYRFGTITVKQDRLAPDFIAKFITLKEGDWYSSAAILKQQNTLGESDYFSEIYVQPRRDLAKGYVIPVEIVPVQRKPNKYSIGFGFSTDTGIRGSLGWERRLINTRGHRLATGVSGSGIGAGVAARYRIPIRDPREDEFSMTASYALERPENSESNIAQFGAARMVMRGNWRETIAVDFQNEDFIVGQQKDTVQLTVPSIDWTRIVPRRVLVVPQGHRLSATIRGANENLLSDNTFLQTRVHTKWIIAVGKSGRFLTRGEAGYSAVDTVFDLPASYRYFAGGDQSIRGYGFASLGPVNPEGEVIGGKHLLVGSVEYEHRIIGKWSMAAFFDAGNAFNTLDNFDVAQGAGIGVRWSSPIGQIRVDLASALSEEDRPWRVHISIGPDL